MGDGGGRRKEREGEEKKGKEKEDRTEVLKDETEVYH